MAKDYYLKIDNNQFKQVKNKLHSNYINELISENFDTREEYITALLNEEKRIFLLNEGMNQNDFLISP